MSGMTEEGELELERARWYVQCSHAHNAELKPAEQTGLIIQRKQQMGSSYNQSHAPEKN